MSTSVSYFLPKNYCRLLQSCLTDRQLRVAHDKSIFDRIQAAVPYGSVLGPTLYFFYTQNLQVDDKITAVTFADDTASLSGSGNQTVATENLQRLLNRV